MLSALGVFSLGSPLTGLREPTVSTNRHHFLRRKQVPFFPNLERKAVVERSSIINFLATVSYFQFRTY